MRTTTNNIVTATVVAGTLDILAATGLTLYFKRHVGDMLRYVASGPFPGAMGWGRAGAFAGLAVHYILMAIMAAVFMLAVERRPRLDANPWVAGVGYGILTYIVLDLIVVPLRFGKMPSALSVATQLFCHIVLVGLPMAFIARRRPA